MARIGTFGSFTQARLAIYASQAGLQVSGNNIANINTEGYTRQRLEQTSFYTGGADRYYSQYDIRVGNGVLTTGVSQLRDPYLDIRYRDEISDVGFMDAKLAGLENIQRVLDEVGDGDDDFGVLEAQFSEVYDALMQLTDQTGHQEYDIQVRAAAKALTDQMRSYASQLQSTYENAVAAFEQDVEDVNTILTSIRDLNATIRKAEIHGDNALELRDARNELIDQLAEYMKIDVVYTEEDIGGGVTVEKLTINLGNANPEAQVETDSTTLIDGIYGAQFQIDATMPELNPNYDPANPNSPRYLGTDAGGNPVAVADPANANQVPNTNFNLTVTELRDSRDQLLYTLEKHAEFQVDPVPPGFNGQAVTQPQPDGTIDITTYRKYVNTVIRPMANTDPATSATLPYLMQQVDQQGNPVVDAQGSPVMVPTDDAAAAAKVRVRETTWYAQPYTKHPSVAIGLDDNDLHGALQAQRELLTEEGEFAGAATIAAVDENAASKRGIRYYQKALDLLANQFAAAMNEANQGYIRNEKGNYVTAAGDEILLAGQAIPANITELADLTAGQLAALNNPQTVEDAKTALAAYLDNNGGQKVGGVLFSNHGDGDDTTNITASNISISHSWSLENIIVRSFEQHSDMDVASTDSSNILHMSNLFFTKMDYNPSVIGPTTGDVPMFNGTFQEMWQNIGATLGSDMMYTETMLDMHYASSIQLDTSRDSVSSVDLNDEAMNLMQYSKSYNAACRLMTTIDSILDKLINGTGMTR